MVCFLGCSISIVRPEQIVSDMSRNLKLLTISVQHHWCTMGRILYFNSTLLMYTGAYTLIKFLKLTTSIFTLLSWHHITSLSCMPSHHCLKFSLLGWCHLQTCKWSWSRIWQKSCWCIWSIVRGLERSLVDCGCWEWPWQMYLCLSLLTVAQRLRSQDSSWKRVTKC